ncbi:hypothetical protein OIU74_017459 [Salix koriyanagi]|uniref:Uncharacterized protein n=1 Tax=Salix koriyanagi TaxID=2511006 RepID=A0A9Q0WPX3_9ROSI|nr:hypothetical protein OIU74_017459 [Salix koriyanagi]
MRLLDMIRIVVKQFVWPAAEKPWSPYGALRSKIKDFMATKHFESLRGKLAGFSIFPIRGCINGCRDPTQTSGFGSSVWNLSDRPVELQIRTYMPGRSGGASGGGNKNLLYYYDEAFHPYIWVHDTGGDFSRMVKQQYISLEDLRDYSEIRIFRDHQRGSILVRKKPRPEFC